MTYKEYVKDVFIEYHNCMGMDLEEAEDIFNESPFMKVENWLYKIGYDLAVEYRFEVKKNG